MQPISFKAKLVTFTEIKKVNGADLAPQKAALIEFLPENPQDLKALNDAKTRFFKYNELDWKAIGNEKRHIYGLTTQVDSFEKPVSKKLLGTVSVYEDLKTKKGFIDSVKIKNEPKNAAKSPKFVEFLPKINLFSGGLKKSSNVAYRGVKTAIIDALKSVYEQMSVAGSGKSTEFFKKHGFVALIPKDKNFLTWLR